MRLSNEEFAAEVLRRSAEKQRASRIRMKRIYTAVGAVAACFVIAVGIGFYQSRNMKNAADISLTPRADIAAENAGNAPQYSEHRSAEEFNTENKSDAQHIQGRRSLTFAQTTAHWDLRETPEITVQIKNQGKEALTLSAHDFILKQGDQSYTLPEDAEAESVTVEPGESAAVKIPAAEIVGEARGEFQLICPPADTGLVLTLD